MLLPGLTWTGLNRTQKSNSIVQVNWAIQKVKFVGKILFIQTTPSPYPFLRYTDVEKEEIGNAVFELAKQHNIELQQTNKLQSTPIHS